MQNWRRPPALAPFNADYLDGPELALRALPHRGLLLLRCRGDASSISDVVFQSIGQVLPLVPNTSSIGELSALWLGPHEWLICSDPAAAPRINRQLREALSHYTCLVSDVGDARFGIEVSGVRARSVLAKVCGLDLRSSTFGPGRCAQSLLVRIPMLLHQIDDVPRLHLFVDRSYAHYAWNWLVDAAEEFASGPTR